MQLGTATATGDSCCVNVGAFDPQNSANLTSGDGSRVGRSANEIKTDSGGIKHGDFVKNGGGLFQYQQAGDGAFIGVGPEEWDLVDRTLNLSPLKCTNDRPFNFMDYYSSPHMAATAKS